MNEAPSSAWFYTRQGEQQGPVAFADLQRMARDGELNPRLDMAWTQGMEGWKPTGEIEDLFEKRAAPETPAPASSTPAADPYAPPQQNEASALIGPESGWPGARRRSFYLMTILFPFVWNIGFSLAVPLLKQQFGAEITTMAVFGAIFVPVIVAIVFGLKRLVNVGMSRWWYLGSFVPLLNLWVCYRMYVCPAGYAFHKKLDGAGIVLAIIYWLLLLLSVLMVASFIAMMLGAIGTPEMRQQLEEAIRNMNKGGH